jgi:hypothetical protein
MNARLLRYGFLAAALVALPAGAQLYKWTDANGRVQYSDKPPPAGQKATAMSKATMSPAPASGAAAPAAAEKSTAEREQEFRKRQAEQQDAQKKQDQLAEGRRVKQANCDSAQKQFAAMQAGGRLVTFDEKGERQFLDDAQTQQALQKAQQDVTKYCN